MKPLCPQSNNPGIPVKPITLKALLQPKALECLDPTVTYHFCDAPDCEVVYFSDNSQFRVADLSVSVYQKQQVQNALVCYCFGHTRDDLEQHPQLEESIRAHTRANRCGCEVRNPQGGCCLGNVKTILNQAAKSG